MEDSIEARIERLMDQLENPNLTEGQIEKVKDKIRFFQGLQS